MRVTVLGHSLERTNYYDLMYWLIGPRARDLGLHGAVAVVAVTAVHVVLQARARGSLRTMKEGCGRRLRLSH